MDERRPTRQTEADEDGGPLPPHLKEVIFLEVESTPTSGAIRGSYRGPQSALMLVAELLGLGVGVVAWERVGPTCGVVVMILITLVVALWALMFLRKQRG